MTINRTTLTALGLGVLFSAIALLVAVQFRPIAQWIINILGQGSGTMSPIRVLGGSTTFESDYGWRPVSGCAPNGQDPDTCAYVIGKDAPQAFIAKHIYVDSQSVTLNVTGAWQITTTEYSANGANVGAAGPTVCGSGDGATCNTSSAGRYLLVSPGPNGSFFGLDGPPMYDGQSYVGKRYHSTDAKCHIEKGDFCDHLAQVTVTINGTKNGPYQCPVGRCGVRVDNN